MEPNKKKFAVAAIAPIVILAGILLYISPFSTDADSGPNAKQSWANNSGEVSMRGNGRGASSYHGDSAITTQDEQGLAYASPHESWGKNRNESFMRGNGRGRSSSHGNSDIATQRGRGKGYASSHNNSNSASSQYENQGLPSQQRGNGRGAGNQSIPQNYSAPYSQDPATTPESLNPDGVPSWRDTKATKTFV